MRETTGVEIGISAAARLAQLGNCRFDAGLSDSEFSIIEERYGFEFSEDHRVFLAQRLPVFSEPKENAAWENPWPDWRSGDPEKLQAWIEAPVTDLLDLTRDGWWHSSWGSQPNDCAEALEIASQALKRVPKLAPVYGHRYLPAQRGAYGHPVLSVYETDIICYGRDLADYVDREFGGVTPGMSPRPCSTVAFWSEFIEN
ncbi:hypothetical protein I3F58_02505 [Streptomyces sp. MUM 203J]|uniref:hypothetical protein n=1 Tax=Streptomyces sp. MUM 203J TaxID=2791990 RepID=UPI001F036320|nr:hypothetical protein [Streptomyces sp. MUM 203J]MCH0538450.1 hypothetical protein [Streptomyces sp. MUM 203J]